MLEAHRRQEVTLERIVERLKLSRDLSHNPLYQAGFTFSPPAELTLPGLEVEPLSVHTGSSQLDLFVTLWEAGTEVRGRIEYSTDLFERATMERFAGHYGTLLSSIAQDADRPIAALAILPEAQKRQLLVQWNDTQADYPRDRCIHQWFEAQARADAGESGGGLRGAAAHLSRVERAGEPVGSPAAIARGRAGSAGRDCRRALHRDGRGIVWHSQGRRGVSAARSDLSGGADRVHAARGRCAHPADAGER